MISAHLLLNRTFCGRREVNFRDLLVDTIDIFSYIHFNDAFLAIIAEWTAHRALDVACTNPCQFKHIKLSRKCIIISRTGPSNDVNGSSLPFILILSQCQNIALKLGSNL
jgi:hypothetical protein